jgi:hypothetical protein
VLASRASFWLKAFAFDLFRSACLNAILIPIKRKDTDSVSQTRLGSPWSVFCHLSSRASSEKLHQNEINSNRDM